MRTENKFTAPPAIFTEETNQGEPALTDDEPGEKLRLARYTNGGFMYYCI